MLQDVDAKCNSNFENPDNGLGGGKSFDNKFEYGLFLGDGRGGYGTPREK